MAAISDTTGAGILDTAGLAVEDTAADITGDEDGGEILLETGGILLLETGGYLLLEGVAPEPEAEAAGGQGMIDDLYGPDWLNARTFGARGDDHSDSTTAIQAALSTGQNVYLPAGNYVISLALAMVTGQALIGAGSGLTTVTQVNTGADGITGVDVASVSLFGLTLTGPGSGTGVGVSFSVSADTSVPNLAFTDLTVGKFGSHSVSLSAATGARLTGVTAASPGADGFVLSGGTGNVLSSCGTSGCKAVSFSLTGDEAAAVIVGAVEESPDGATAFIQTAAGCSCVVIGDKHTTANSFATGTAYEILYTGGTVH